MIYRRSLSRSTSNCWPIQGSPAMMPAAPGSVVAAFCAVTDTNPESYLRLKAEDVPSLSEGITLRVNDLTGSLYSKGVAGAYGLIDALHELGYITDDARSAQYYAPMMALRVRALVEEVAAEEDKSGTLSGKIDYQEQGGYLRELCKLLGLDFDKVYPQMQELAGKDDKERALSDAAAAKREAEQAGNDQRLAEELVGDYLSKSGWQLSLREDGSYILAAVQDIKFSVGGWSVEKGVPLLGNEPVRMTDEGIYVKEIKEPFSRGSSEDRE
ncbi:hypothetical protein REC12_01070 [Desulfosporosinus sp. PR]|uniref:hypothetical protein n=1 Tax=Candidatus Desulfosporosinus nitrosoreducens TaxID=3401928 RepID=UPI0027E6C754|nr:hypothetical protein [Desulfosporosinus sp. PR]MDQ7092180.1 hypothetical protein [Desulfosporosinus sp. PR]